MPGPTQQTVIAAVDLCEYFVSKNTGNALAGGYVNFWQDSNRAVAKSVYEQTQGAGFPPVYNYVALPNPVNLSGVGTFMDGANNNVSVYYYPYDANGNVQLYYIEVYDSNDVLQFTREAWPPLLSFNNNSYNVTQNNAQTYAPDTGIANTYVITLNPVPFAITPGMIVSFKALNSNNGASTLNVNGFGAVPITKYGQAALVANDILANDIVEVEYTGAAWQILSQPQPQVLPTGTVTSVAAAGLAVASPSPITGSGAITVTAANKAQQEAASSNAVAVTPAVQQYHPSSTQAWAFAGNSGAIIASYNTTSVTNASTGLYVPTFTVNFAGSYALSATLSWQTLGTALSTLIISTFSPSSSSFTIGVVNASNWGYSGASGVYFTANGVQ